MKRGGGVECRLLESLSDLASSPIPSSLRLGITLYFVIPRVPCESTRHQRVSLLQSLKFSTFLTRLHSPFSSYRFPHNQSSNSCSWWCQYGSQSCTCKLQVSRKIPLEPNLKIDLSPTEPKLIFTVSFFPTYPFQLAWTWIFNFEETIVEAGFLPKLPQCQ